LATGLYLSALQSFLASEVITSSSLCLSITTFQNHTSRFSLFLALRPASCNFTFTYMLFHPATDIKQRKKLSKNKGNKNK